MTRQFSGRGLAVFAVLLLLTGCRTAIGGTATPPPHAGDLVSQMDTVMTGLPGGFAVHSTLNLGGPTLTGDIRMQGDDATGTYALGDDRCELRRVAGHDYGKAPAAFWTALAVPAADARAADGRWVEFDDTVGLATELRRTRYLTGYADASDGEFDGVRSAQLGGTAVWQTTQVQNKETLSITRGPEPRLIRRQTDIGRIDFSFPTGTFEVVAPAGAVPLEP